MCSPEALLREAAPSQKLVFFKKKKKRGGITAAEQLKLRGEGKARRPNGNRVSGSDTKGILGLGFRVAH